MNAAPATGTRAERGRRLLPWALIVGGVAVFALVVGRGGNDNGRYLDPTSTGRAGTKAMVDTLRELGADVDQPAGTVEGDNDAAPAPAGNASQADWADWVLANVEGVDEATVRAMKRDELREQYGPKAE